ncbi:MAG: AAA family ATPase [Clostridium sp.]|nr:AAA family ATPase [Clostridium sp.]
MTKIITFANHKGGVGKTTSAVNVGAGFAKKGKKVLLIDLDAQANLTASLSPINYDDTDERTVYEAMLERKNLPIYNVSENLDLVPASLMLSNADMQLINAISRETILKDLIAPIKDKYEYIMIDCPPSLGIMTMNAFVASTDIIIPLTMETLPVKGLIMMQNFLDTIKKTVNPTLNLMGILITNYEGRKINKAYESSVNQQYGKLVFRTKIRKNITVTEAPATHLSLFDYDPTCNASLDYNMLIAEMSAL